LREPENSEGEKKKQLGGKVIGGRGVGRRALINTVMSLEFHERRRIS
jgi:hypothetical protein